MKELKSTTNIFSSIKSILDYIDNVIMFLSFFPNIHIMQPNMCGFYYEEEKVVNYKNVDYKIILPDILNSDIYNQTDGIEIKNYINQKYKNNSDYCYINFAEMMLKYNLEIIDFGIVTNIIDNGFEYYNFNKTEIIAYATDLLSSDSQFCSYCTAKIEYVDGNKKHLIDSEKIFIIKKSLINHLVLDKNRNDLWTIVIMFNDNRNMFIFSFQDKEDDKTNDITDISKKLVYKILKEYNLETDYFDSLINLD